MLSHSNQVLFNNKDLIQKLNKFLDNASLNASMQISKKIFISLNDENQWKQKLVDDFGFAELLATDIYRQGIARDVYVKMSNIKKNNPRRFLLLTHFMTTNRINYNNHLFYIPLFQNVLTQEQINTIKFGNEEIKLSLITAAADANNISLLIQMSSLQINGFRNILYKHLFHTNNLFVINKFKVLTSLQQEKDVYFSGTLLTLAIKGKSIKLVEQIVKSELFNKNRDTFVHLGNIRFMVLDRRTMFFSPEITMKERNEFLNVCVKKNRPDLIEIILQTFYSSSPNFTYSEIDCSNSLLNQTHFSIDQSYLKNVSYRFNKFFSRPDSKLKTQGSSIKLLETENPLLNVLKQCDFKSAAFLISQNYTLNDDELNMLLQPVLANPQGLYQLVHFLLVEQNFQSPVNLSTPSLYKTCFREGDLELFKKIVDPEVREINWLEENDLTTLNYAKTLVMIDKLLHGELGYSLMLSENIKSHYENILKARLAFGIDYAPALVESRSYRV